MEREPWYRVVVAVLLPLRLLFRLDFRGSEHVPRTGGAILVPNHVSLFDPLPVALFVHRAGRRPRFLIMAELFRVPVVGAALRAVRQIPVERETPEAVHALDRAVDAVRRGECVVVYPEGALTRDPDGWPMPGKTGVARLALATGAPVVPVGQWGPQDFLGRSKVPHPERWARLRLYAGPPVDLSAWAGAAPTSETLRAMTDAVMADVTALVAAARRATPPRPSLRRRARPPSAAGRWP